MASKFRTQLLTDHLWAIWFDPAELGDSLIHFNRLSRTLPTGFVLFTERARSGLLILAENPVIEHATRLEDVVAQIYDVASTSFTSKAAP